MRLLAAALITPLLVSTPANKTPASGQVCGPHADVARLLKKEYNEEVIGLGVDSYGYLVELTVAPSGRWTITLTDGDKRRCIVRDGLDWRSKLPEINVEPLKPI